MKKRKETVPHESSVMLACWGEDQLGMKPSWGLAAYVRGDLNRDAWRLLFTVAGDGKASDAAKVGIEYLNWTVMTGSVLVQGDMTGEFRLDKDLEDQIEKDELVKAYVVVQPFSKEEPQIRALHAAAGAVLAVKNNHDFVKELQEAGRAYHSHSHA